MAEVGVIIQGIGVCGVLTVAILFALGFEWYVEMQFLAAFFAVLNIFGCMLFLLSLLVMV